MNIFIGNLSFDATKEDLRKLFEKFGTVVSSVVVMVEKKKPKSRGFGFVDMPDENQANTAINSLNAQEFMGRPLVVNPARTKEEQDKANMERGHFLDRKEDTEEGRKGPRRTRHDSGLSKGGGYKRERYGKNSWRKKESAAPVEEHHVSSDWKDINKDSQPWKNPQREVRPWRKSESESRPWKKTGGEFNSSRRSQGNERPWRKPEGETRPSRNPRSESRPFRKSSGGAKPWQDGNEPWKKPQGDFKPWRKSENDSRPWKKREEPSSSPWKKSEHESRPWKKTTGESRPWKKSSSESRPWKKSGGGFSSRYASPKRPRQ